MQQKVEWGICIIFSYSIQEIFQEQISSFHIKKKRVLLKVLKMKIRLKKRKHKIGYIHQKKNLGQSSVIYFSVCTRIVHR